MGGKENSKRIYYFYIFCLKTGLTSEAVLIPNCLVNVEQTGSNDYWGILHAFPVTEVLKARIYDLEMMLRRVMVKEKESGEGGGSIMITDQQINR